MSNELDMVLPEYELILGECISVNYHVDFVFNTTITPEATGMEYNVDFTFLTNDTPERMQKIHDNFEIVPIYYRIDDGDTQEAEFSREVREWDCVLPFGSDNSTPRRQPTELIYKGKKMKNDFYVPPIEIE